MSIGPIPQIVSDLQAPDDAQTAAERLAAEVKAEDLPDGAVAVPLCGETVRVLHPNDWPSSANEDLQAGRFLSWARKALASPDDFATWEEIDPTNGQVNDFFVEWEAMSGQSLGGSRASRRSSRSTRGR